MFTHSMNRGKVPEMLEFSNCKLRKVTSFEIVGIEPEILVLPRILLHPHLRAVHLLRWHSQLFQESEIANTFWYGTTDQRACETYLIHLVSRLNIPN